MTIMTNIIAEPVTADVENKNLLSPNKFKLVINKFPEIGFWAQSIVLPTITMGQNLIGTNTALHYTAPGDTLEYDDLIISFIMDEDFVAYRRVKEWQELAVTLSESQRNEIYSDLEVLLLTNNSNRNVSFKFKNVWPYLLSTIVLDTTQGEDQPLTVDCNFKFSTFEVTPNLTANSTTL